MTDIYIPEDDDDFLIEELGNAIDQGYLATDDDD